MPAYKNPALTVNIIMEKTGLVLLIKRAKPPYKGLFAIPGGFVGYGESVEAAAVRECKEETGLDAKLEGIAGVYSDPERDPRKHTVSVVFVASAVGGKLKAGDDAADAGWFHPDELLEGDVAFDHWRILQDWRKKGGTYWSSK